ncbi:DnaJ domain-containing protein [Telmatobacter sp. DSM 110680]|uniref:DnaJ domain-containing protein n=1 Tax=Telmatobacter sp. DSM 110680 TaxID=3036704 RepID=A0AAU7DEW2_9BACT
MLEPKKLDFYELLQVSRTAEPDTIHRVYRFFAARYHPDNAVSSDPEKFALLRLAYETLSDPHRRAEYDASNGRASGDHPPLSTTIDFMDDMEGERNRRLAVLAVLYYRRRANPYSPVVSLAEVEAHMGFPRDFLDFTTWYLLRKNYITRADNSDFALTVEGVEFVETGRVQIPILNKLLTDGSLQIPREKEKPEATATEHCERELFRSEHYLGNSDSSPSFTGDAGQTLPSPAQDALDTASAPDPNPSCEMPDIFACLKPATDDFDIDAIREAVTGKLRKTTVAPVAA